MTGDTLTVTTAAQPDLEDRAVWLHFLASSALNSTDDMAVVTHAHAISLLREDVDAALQAAAAIFEQAREDPLLRWSVANTVAAIKDPACIGFLYQQASVDFGERNPKVCGEPRDSEVLVGIMAAEGLGYLDSADDARVIQALTGIVRDQKEPAVREAAGQPLLGLLKRAKQQPPPDIAPELERIAALRVLVADDVVIDPGDIDVQPPKRKLTPRPMPYDGDPSARTDLVDEGEHRGRV